VRARHHDDLRLVGRARPARPPAAAAAAAAPLPSASASSSAIGRVRGARQQIDLQQS